MRRALDIGTTVALGFEPNHPAELFWTAWLAYHGRL
jgi:hypothetical protein